MIKHIVFWKLKEQSDQHLIKEHALIIKNKLEALEGKVEGLIHIEVGIDFSCTEMSANVALYSEFDSTQALNEYQKHPQHVEAAQFIGSVTASRQVVDYEI